MHDANKSHEGLAEKGKIKAPVLQMLRYMLNFKHVIIPLFSGELLMCLVTHVHKLLQGCRLGTSPVLILI